MNKQLTMKKYITTGFLTLAVFVSIGFATPTFAQTTDVAAQIKDLLAQIKALRAQVTQLQGQPASASACLSLSYNLYADQVDARTNGEVTKLQQFLAQDASIYPAGLITGYFGPKTEAAVREWQEKNGVISSGSPDTTGYGYVGPRTRAAMACGGSANSVITTITNTTPLSPTVSFQASPTTVGAERKSKLSWSTTNVNRCVLQYGSSEKNVGINGSKVVSPSQTTSYRLWCVNDPGTGYDGPSAEKTISVSVASPSCSLTTNKSSYQLGEDIVFSWTSKNATYSTFQQDTSGRDHLYFSGDKNDTNGSYSTTANVYGNPSATLLIYNYYGNSSCSVTVPVNQ